MAKTLNVMPLGDSITQGYSNLGDVESDGDERNSELGGYRTTLWQRLNEGPWQRFGLTIDFVGDYEGDPNSVEGFDPHHQGVAGIRSDQLLSGVTWNFEGYGPVPSAGTAVAHHAPGVVLLMAGSNDVYQYAVNGTPLDPGDIGRIIDQIQDVTPNIQIVVSTIPPPSDLHPGVADLREQQVVAANWNSAIENEVRTRTSVGEQVYLVSTADALQPADITPLGYNNDQDFTGVHPTRAGYQKIGELWYEGMIESLLRAGGTVSKATSAAENHPGGTDLDAVDYSASTAAVNIPLCRPDPGGIAGYTDANLGLGRGSGGYALGDTCAGIEGVIGSRFGDRVFGSDQGAIAVLGDGNDAFDNRESENVIDVVNGGKGNDRISTGGGNDQIYGGAGNDWLIGEAGADWIIGGPGVDEVIYTASPVGVIVNLGPSTPPPSSSSPGGWLPLQVNQGGSGGHAQGDSFPLGDIENVVGSFFGDQLYGTLGANLLKGEDGNDLLHGAAGNDQLSGGAGNDTLDGAEGDDILSGASGRDSLIGGTGNDRLTGGAGRADTLDGGLGYDILVYTSLDDSAPGVSTRDQITFGSPGLMVEDRIDVSAIDANLTLDGNQGFTFIGTAAFTAPGQIRVQDTSGHTIIRFNVDADLDPEMEILSLDGTQYAAKHYVASDFTL